ncbi:MAG TPA: hypothetical protein VGO53_16590 [Steroidobacteraceae bacterium]|jgi:hypothetical protein|nr:hypothetical protein [Steroidobacteraceae bacterium]
MTEPGPAKAQTVDSLAAPVMAIMTNRRVGGWLWRALPWLFCLVTGYAGDMLGEYRTRYSLKAEMQAYLDVRAADKTRDALATQRHADEMAALAELDRKLLDESQKAPGRVIALERGQWFTWRALAELRAAAYAGQTAKHTELMDRLGQKFAVMWTKAAVQQEPGVAYDYVFSHAHVE